MGTSFKKYYVLQTTDQIILVACLIIYYGVYIATLSPSFKSLLLIRRKVTRATVLLLYTEHRILCT